jgi:hypothetical protein
MCECSRCKKQYQEYELNWIQASPTYYMQPRKSMELVCNECIHEYLGTQEEITSSSISSLSS